jgi:HSP20 family protein
MSLVRYSRTLDPLNSLLRLQGEFLRAFESPLHYSVSADQKLQTDADELGYSVRLELPGVAPERVNVEARDHVLSISVEKEPIAEEGTSEKETQVEFSRTIRLPNDADPARVEATHRYGVLTLCIPKREEAQPRQIPITVTAA